MYIFFYLIKLSRSWGQFSSTVLVIDQILICTNAVLENGLQFQDSFLKWIKRCISRSMFYAILCDQKNYDKNCIEKWQNSTMSIVQV